MSCYKLNYSDLLTVTITNKCDDVHTLQSRSWENDYYKY